MRAEQYLNQLKWIKRQMMCKRRDAVMWRSLAESLSIANDGDRVQTSGSQDKMADAVSKAVDCEREADKMLTSMIALQRDIINKIENLDNVNHCLILTEYYLHGMTIQQISDEWSRSVRHIKRIKADAIREFSEKYGNSF